MKQGAGQCSLKDFSKCITASTSAKLLANIRKLSDKFKGRGESKLIMRFGEVIISMIMSTSKCSQTGCLLVIISRQRWQNIWLFFFSKLIVFKFGLSNFTVCNSDSQALWNDRLTMQVNKINPLTMPDMSMRNRTFMK